jgi:hypothetical protein
VWRASEALTLGAVIWFVLALALHAAALRAGPAWSLWRLDAAAPVRAFLRLAGDALTQGALLIGRDIPPDRVVATGRWRAAAGTWRGLLVSVPIVLVLNALLMSADPIWEKQAARLLDVDLWSIVGHVAAVTVLAWLAAGWLRGALLSAPTKPMQVAPAAAPRFVRAADVLTPLVLVNVLFGLFVAMQLRTLVGGAEYVRAVAGLTFAEYARRGFFQLVFVAALTLPALYAADALTPLDHRARRGVHRAIAVMLVLLGGILASAGARMALYTREYGLTEDRFYASAAMVWLVPLLAWFALTVLRDRPERFTGGALVSAWATWAVLVVLNPDALVVRTNVARIADGRRFDPAYVSQLGKDAAPALVAALPTMPAADACVVRRALVGSATHDQRQRESGARDWRAWSVASWRAGRAQARAGVSAGATVEPCPSDVVAPAATPAATP